MNEELLKRRISDERRRRSVERLRASLRDEAIKYGICPDCSGNLVRRRGNLLNWLSGSNRYVCASCERKHAEYFMDY